MLAVNMVGCPAGTSSAGAYTALAPQFNGLTEATACWLDREQLAQQEYWTVSRTLPEFSGQCHSKFAG